MVQTINPAEKRQWFGTDGIRGAFGQDPMTPAFAYACARASARYFQRTNENPNPLFVIIRDTRESGILLEQALEQGFTSANAFTRCLGILPTGAMPALLKNYEADAGIVISASHNEYQDNGIKFFGGDGFKLSDKAELEIEHLITEELQTPYSLNLENRPFEATSSGEGVLVYRNHLLASVPDDFSLKGISVILDGANGSATVLIDDLLEDRGATVHKIGFEPNGTNINKKCGSQHPQDLIEAVKQSGKSIGIAFDGDADRILLVDETGSALDGDDILAILGLHLKKENKLNHNAVVATVMSNYGLEDLFKQHGIKLIRTNVGDRYVLEKLREFHYSLGGEQSGHIISFDYTQTGDGLLTALQILHLMQKENKTLHQLRQVLQKYPQKLVNLPVQAKPDLESISQIQFALKSIEQDLNGDGRILLRYSGTENKIRILLEAKSSDSFERHLETITQAITETIG
jgi:phosphoglucosamine mutase